MPKGKTIREATLYELSTLVPVTRLVTFHSPVEEYLSAFKDPKREFLHYYMGGMERRSLTRGDFLALVGAAASYLADAGIGKGDHVVHCFSANSVYDLAFRFAAVWLGCVPATINWQADDNEMIVYKAEVTGAKAILYDAAFAERIGQMKSSLNASLLPVEKMDDYPVRELPHPVVTYADERIIVFTSGTTSRPKGVSLPHRSYLANRLTFEDYFHLGDDARLDLLIVNPLHHANSTALTDWAMRRPGTVIHLVDKYSTEYWKVLVDVASRKRDRLIASLVPRHFDFLENLAAEGNLPVEESKIKEGLSKTDILIGSAPVGPTTVNRIRKFSGHLPHVRFGSTETCLEVMATPSDMPVGELMTAFEKGWSHQYQGEATTGYYIGREHFLFTRVRLVRSIDAESPDYFKPCVAGEPGYLVTQGPNIMDGYVGQAEASRLAFREGWYTGLKDIAFALQNEKDGRLDYYWSSRDSELLVRGGAKYAYDQVASRLSRFVAEQLGLKAEEFQMAVVGLRLESEHEDSCCVTIELKSESAGLESKLKEFLCQAQKTAPKGTKPDYVRFARIPRSFKGAILYPQLRQEFSEAFQKGGAYALHKVGKS